jgi:hypothetical protein
VPGVGIRASSLGAAAAMGGLRAAKGNPGVVQGRRAIVDNFGTRPGAPEKAPFDPLRRTKTALALAPEGVSPKNVKLGKAKQGAF